MEHFREGVPPYRVVMRVTYMAGTKSVQWAPGSTLMRPLEHDDNAAPLIETPESFDQYYKRDYRQLLGLAYVLTGSSWVAEDLVQEALTEAHNKWDVISRYDQPGSWVRRVLVNRSTSRFRRLKSEAKAVTRIGHQRAEVVQPTERQTEIWTSVSMLPARQAQVIALFYWEDQPIAEIGKLLDCSPETVKTHLKRARATLATKLSAHQGDAI